MTVVQKKKAVVSKKSSLKKRKTFLDEIREVYNKDTKNGTITRRENLAKMGYHSMIDLLKKVE